MVKNYLKSVRITNLILLGVLFWGIMYQTYNNEFSFCIDHLLLFLAIISTTASGYLINNYYDIRSDEINGKSLLKLTSNYLIKGYFLHFILSFVFLVISNLDGGWFIFNLFLHVLLLLYSLKLQHLPILGNLIVAILCAMVILIPMRLSNQYFNFFNFNLEENSAILYAVFCFIITLKREVIKDIEDYKGDKTIGSHTLPIVLGISFTKVYIYLLIIAELLYMFLCIQETIYELSFTLFYLIQFCIIIYISYKIYSNSKYEEFKASSMLVKLQFLFAGIALYVL